MATAWQLTTPAPPHELARRLSALFTQDGDPDRNLYVSPHHRREVTEAGFRFACSPALGRLKVLIWCAGEFAPGATGTVVRVRQHPAAQVFAVFGLVAVPFSALLGWGLLAVSGAAAVGAVVGVCLLLAGLLGLGAWQSRRWTRQQLQDILAGPDREGAGRA